MLFADLYLNNNHIKEIAAGAFESNLMSLIDLKNNDIRELRVGVFCKLEILRYLDLSNNSIVNLEAGVLKESKIIHIRLNQNKLKNIKKGIFNNVKFRILNLEDNEISYFQPGCFHDISEITLMDLRNNKIEEIDKNMFNWSPVLQFVYLEGNNALNNVNVSDFKEELPMLVSFEHPLPIVI